MKHRFFITAICFLMMWLFSSTLLSQTKENLDEQYRPKIHFTPKEHWINDPNGMVFYKGTYHLFFQYHPYSSVWGPMHWGHATSTDMIHWKRRPVAIYPDSIGTIFSGSAVVDKNNTSGFGEKGQPPLVAIFTQHNTEGEKAGRNDFQNQSLAYSNDDGRTWIKYAGNPVLKNPGITDFRDPKVMWYQPQKKWVMTLATKDRITFYSSPDLKDWKKESEFGKEPGAHGGVWECPDLITLDDNGKQRWVLIVNLNPGAPNGGSGTQYFVGDFDGKTFTTTQAGIRWLDYGPDNYAGVTWSNTGKRRILLGWMSNWNYADKVPTETYRNAMTLPRELKIRHVGNNLLVTSHPVSELSKIQSLPVVIKDLKLTRNLNTIKQKVDFHLPCRIDLSSSVAQDFSIVLSNDADKLVIGYDKDKKQYYIDRSKSGYIDFQKDFAGRHTAPRLSDKPDMNLSLLLDVSSVELFADDGVTVMTELFFPHKPYNTIQIQSDDEMILQKFEYSRLQNSWR